MIDYAHVKVLENEQVKSRETTKTIVVSPLYFFLTIAMSLLVYFAAYQNMSIAETKHKINQQKVILHHLLIEQQNLAMTEAKYTNSKRILSLMPKHLSYNNIHIEN